MGIMEKSQKDSDKGGVKVDSAREGVVTPTLQLLATPQSCLVER